MTIDARHAAKASGSSHRKPTDLFGGNLEKFALIETAGYSACRSGVVKEFVLDMNFWSEQTVFS
jgi:hypothetical protein